MKKESLKISLSNRDLSGSLGVPNKTSTRASAETKIQMGQDHHCWLCGRATVPNEQIGRHFRTLLTPPPPSPWRTPLEPLPLLCIQLFPERRSLVCRNNQTKFNQAYCLSVSTEERGQTLQNAPFSRTLDSLQETVEENATF